VTTEEGSRRPSRRIILILVLLFLALAAAGAATVAIVTLGVREELEEGRRAVDRGRSALLEGRIADATRSFEHARRAFRAAHTEATSGPSTLARLVPVLGRTLDVVVALADAGEHGARAGVEMALALEQLPGGIDALAPTDGTLPFEAFSSLAEPLEQARSETALAVEAIRSSPSGALPGPVADARRQALEQVEKVGHALNSWHAFALGLPGFAGGDGPRRYLFFAENPAEPRGTGGLWGAYSILRVKEGKLSFSGFRPVQTLRNLPPDVAPAPNPDYRRNYERWGAPGYWLNMNMTPDFPSAARAALGTWEAIGGEPLDGVLTADPFTLKHLLDVTGAIRLSRPPLVVTEGNVVSLLSNRAFARFPDPAIRKALLGDVALAVFDRFLGLDGLVVPRLRAMGRSVADGHLKIFTVDPTMQEALVRAGLDSGLRPTRGDLLGVVVNAGAGGKVDFFAQRSVHHEVTLLPDSASTAITITTIKNGAPTSGQPGYVIGPHRGRAGDNIPLLSVFCGRRCRLVRAERDGDRVDLFTGSELGYPYYQDYFTIPSKGTGVLTVRTETPGSWEGDASGGSYRLTILGQTTIRPTPANIRISAPDGMRFTTGSEGIQIQNHTATWEGVLQGSLELEVWFEAPSLPVRLWRAIFDRA
jgi:Protein of unknown function (DUF4012)